MLHLTTKFHENWSSSLSVYFFSNLSFKDKKLLAYFFILCLIFISVHSVLHSLKKLYRKGRDVVNIVKLESISLCILFLFFILFSHQHTVPLVILVSIPVGVLYSYYFAHRTGNYLSNVEIILLVCALIIARSSNFIN